MTVAHRDRTFSISLARLMCRTQPIWQAGSPLLLPNIHRLIVMSKYKYLYYTFILCQCII